MNVELMDSMGSDLTVVNAARVSFAKEKQALGWSGVTGEKLRPVIHDTDVRLIRFLAEHKHWSPFSHVFLQFRVKAPIFVARQLGKHQVGLAWNEVSRRYVDYEPEFYTPEKWRLRAENVKQGSSSETTEYNITATMQFVQQTYDNLLKEGVAPEMARMVLPQNMYTEWYWSGSLYAFARVCQLRLDSTAQVEVQEIARQLSAHCLTLFPHSWNALMKGTYDERITD
jgi:thymidylate synthase (FAD)